ncbi:hypothetical protein BR93DRAFT_627353 [Coniochaeta sp. PMI_546]|nr:hypothetical protein BR93DRAFT_627353 [Coniochaeta sp. PMI_546]
MVLYSDNVLFRCYLRVPLLTCSSYLDVSTIEERLSTPRFDFESDVGNDHPSQDDVLEPIASVGPINSPPTEQPSAEFMAPSRPMRKPKARTLRNEDWAPVKNRVVELLKEKPLGEVRSMIFTEFGFQATERQYKSVLKKWNVTKNIRRPEMKAIVRKLQSRKLTEVDKRNLTFTVGDEVVPEEKINRFMKRENIPTDALYSPSSGAETPADGVLACWTPAAQSTMERTPTPSLPGQALATSGRSFHSHDVNTSPALSSIITLSDPRPFERQSPRLAHQPLPALVGQATDVLLQRQLLGLEARYGEGSEATLSTLKELCLVLTIRARYASAETIARKRLAACRSLYGDLHIDTGLCRFELGAIFYLQGYYHDALKVLQRAASNLGESVGPRSRHYLELQLFSGITYLSLDLPLTAIDVLRPYGEIAFQVLGEADPVTLSFQTWLLPALLALGKSLEAENRARAVKLFEYPFYS